MSTLKSFENKILLTIIFTLLVLVTIAQKNKTNNIGMALVKFMNSQKVIDNFSHSNYEHDSLLILVDLNNLTSGYQIDSWKGIKLNVLKNGPLVDSLRLLNAHALLKGRCNYYILRSRKESKNVTFISLQHACTNLVSNVRILEKNRFFYLGPIENAVW